MTEPRPALRYVLPIVLESGPHCERLLWIGRLALDFCRRDPDGPGESLLHCLALSERVRRRAAQLRWSRRVQGWMVSP